MLKSQFVYLLSIFFIIIDTNQSEAKGVGGGIGGLGVASAGGSGGASLGGSGGSVNVGGFGGGGNYGSYNRRNTPTRQKCYQSGNGYNNNKYEAIYCTEKEENACYHVKSTGEMGCFTLNNITIQRGCNYECDDPKDCSIRDQATVGNLPPLKKSDKKGKGDICLCTGNLCNNIWWSGG